MRCKTLNFTKIKKCVLKRYCFKRNHFFYEKNANSQNRKKVPALYRLLKIEDFDFVVFSENPPYSWLKKLQKKSPKKLNQNTNFYKKKSWKLKNMTYIPPFYRLALIIRCLNKFLSILCFRTSLANCILREWINLPYFFRIIN